MNVYRKLGWYPIIAVGLTGAAFSVIKTGRDALFFSKTGLDQLPWANLWSEVGLAFGAYVHLAAMKKFGTRRARTGAFFLNGLLFAALVPLISTGETIVVQALFPIVPVVFAALFATSWLLAGDMMEGADEKLTQRVYSLTGASAMIGGILGGLGARALSEQLSASQLIGAGAIIFVINGFWCSRAHARRKVLVDSGAAMSAAVMPVAERPDVSSDVISLIKHPYTRVLLLISSLAALAAMYIEFQFYAAAFVSGKAGPQFFADYYVFLCIASLVLQLAVTPWIQSRWGVSRALLVLPLGVLGGAGLVAYTATVLTQSVFRVIETSLKNSIHRSSWEQVFLHFDRERRGAVKVMIDGTVPRVAGVAGSIGLYFIISSEAAMKAMPVVGTWLALALVPVAALWILATRTLERHTSPAQACPVRLKADDHEIRIPES